MNFNALVSLLCFLFLHSLLDVDVYGVPINSENSTEDDIFAVLGCRKTTLTDPNPNDYTSLLDLRRSDRDYDWECAVRVDEISANFTTIFQYNDFTPEFVPGSEDFKGWRMVQWRSETTGEIISNPYHLEEGPPHLYSLYNNTILLADDLAMVLNGSPVLYDDRSTLRFIDDTRLVISINLTNTSLSTVSMHLTQNIQSIGVNTNTNTVIYFEDESIRINITTNTPIPFEVSNDKGVIIYNISELKTRGFRSASIQLEVEANGETFTRAITTTHLILFYLLVFLLIFCFINNKREISNSNLNLNVASSAV